MAENKKPPLGIPPYGIITTMRIKDIVKAMDRYIEDGNINTYLFTIWAKELICQCELLEKMERGSNDSQDNNI